MALFFIKHVKLPKVLRRGGDVAICLDNISKLERRSEVLLLHEPSINQFPLLGGVGELNLGKSIS